MSGVFFRSTEVQLAYLALNIKDAFQEKKKVLTVFFDLSNAFDKVWKEGLLVKLLRTGVRCKMCMWIQHFLFARTARVNLDGILNKKVCLREGVPQGGVLPFTLFLVYINDILTTISKKISNILHADDLAIWNASENTTWLTWMPKIEKIEGSSLQKLALMRKLTGATCGADSSILTTVYTATVQPAMEYASTTRGTAAKTNKS